MTAQILFLDAARAKATPVPASPAGFAALSQDMIEARDQWGRTPLLRAIVDGTLADMRALLDAGADVNAALDGITALGFEPGETALMLAAPEPAKLALLLQHGADPQQGPHGGLLSWILRELDEDNGEVPDYFEGLENSLAFLKRH
jgi:ankyrin repeat protein